MKVLFWKIVKNFLIFYLLFPAISGIVVMFWGRGQKRPTWIHMKDGLVKLLMRDNLAHGINVSRTKAAYLDSKEVRQNGKV